MNTCECGCGRTVAKRFAHGHNRRKPLVYVVDSETGCWVWQGAKSSQGYGSVRERANGGTGQTLKAHRVFYEEHVGPIPVGLHIDHLCRNHACVNPAHLEPVTNADNARRGSTTVLTAENVAQIKRRVADACVGRTQVLIGTHERLAAEYGVKRSTIKSITDGKSWRDIEPAPAHEQVGLAA